MIVDVGFWQILLQKSAIEKRASSAIFLKPFVASRSIWERRL
jgi:hypothetical protein